MKVNLIKYSKFYILKIDSNNIFIYDELLSKDFHITESITYDETTISLISPSFEIKYDVGHNNIKRLRNLIQQFIESNLIIPKIIAVEPNIIVPKIIAMDAKKYKILLVGNIGVGKTSFIRRLQEKPFNEEYEPSTGMSWHIIKSPSTDTSFKLYDIYNPERQSIVYSQIYDAAIIMYDRFNVTDNYKWYNMIKKIKKRQEKIPVIVYHNKCDVTQCIGQLCILENQMLPYYEISVKNNMNVFNAFDALEKLCEKIEK